MKEKTEFQKKIMERFPDLDWQNSDNLFNIYLTHGNDNVLGYIFIHKDYFYYYKHGGDESIIISEEQIPKIVKHETRFKNFA